MTDPDIDGYKAAQVELRAKTGRIVPFFTPTETIWPEGTQLGANGEPLDPATVPLASGFASAGVVCSVASRPARGAMQPAVDDVQLGLHPTNHILLACGKDLYDEADLDDATQAQVFGLRYKIESAIPDQVGPGDVQRMLIFLERM